MLPELTCRILDGWDNFLQGVDKPKVINYLGIPGSVEGGTTTFLAFGDKYSKPVFAVKVHRDPDGQDLILNERDILNYLQVKGGLLAASVPQVILCERIGHTWVLVQSILEGRPMCAKVTNNGIPKVEEAAEKFDLACRWLSNMHVVTQENEVLKFEEARKDTLNIIQEFPNTFELSNEEYGFVQKIADNLNFLSYAGLFLRHGDFCRHNILIDRCRGKTKISVIDWTFGRRAALPLHDLLFFVTTYFLQVRKHHGIPGFTRAFEYTFFDKSSYSELVKRYIAEYCQQIGIDLSLIKPLFAIFLMNQAILEYKKVLRCSRYGGLPRFTVYLATFENRPYHQALKEQLWIYFFHMFVKEQHRFII
jgi:hypothetical protein